MTVKEDHGNIARRTKMAAPYEIRLAIHWLANLITWMDPRGEGATRDLHTELDE